MENTFKYYVAPEGKIFDRKYSENEDFHLYAKELYIGDNDSIDNYILIDDPSFEGSDVKERTE